MVVVTSTLPAQKASGVVIEDVTEQASKPAESPVQEAAEAVLPAPAEIPAHESPPASPGPVQSSAPATPAPGESHATTPALSPQPPATPKSGVSQSRPASAGKLESS